MTMTLALKRILVAVDFSECSRIAFEYAGVLGRTFSCAVHLIHVVDAGYVDRTAEVFGKRRDEIAQALCRRARDSFKAFLEHSREAAVVTETIVAVGVPFQTIALRAQSLPADLIVIGGHGRVGDGEIDKIFFGSTAERVVRLLPCPVLCVPREIARAEEPDSTQKSVSAKAR